MEPREEKIMGLAFKAVDHSHREKLTAHRVVTAGDLAKTSDASLEDWGVPKKAIAQLRQAQKKLGVGMSNPVNVTIKKTLVVMNENSKIGFGVFADQTVGDLLLQKKTRRLRWLYYNVAHIDFTDEIKEKIGLKHTIDKPGVNKEMHELNNAEVERNVKGLLKLKIKMHVSKTLRIEEMERRKARAKEFTKGKMQWANHGHGRLKVSSDEEHITDRMFEKEIRAAGYNLPKTPKAPVPRVKLNYAKLYREFLATVPDRMVEEKRMFLANVLFMDYIKDNYPNRIQKAREFLYKDFVCPSYYDTLLKLNLDYDRLQYVVSSRQPTLYTVFLNNPDTGERFFLTNYALETETTPDGMRLLLFNEDTFKRMPLSDTFAAYTAEKGLEDGNSILVRLKDIEKVILKKMPRKSKGVKKEAVTTRPRKSNRGVAPMNFDFKIKDDRLFIRLHDDKKDLIYEEFYRWLERNPKTIPTLLTALTLPIVKLEDED